jgi:hypothetical protein
MEPTTWEALSKADNKINITVLLKHLALPFLKENTFEYSPPFLIFYCKHKHKEASAQLEAGETNIIEFHQSSLIPLPNELLSFYENFDNRKFPREPLNFLKREYYIVTFTDQYIHGVDGNGYGALIYMVADQFALKLYGPDENAYEIIFQMHILCEALSK